jgi:hypothetical protein
MFGMGNLGAFHKYIAEALHIPFDKALKGTARIKQDGTLKALEISGTTRNPNDWL